MNGGLKSISQIQQDLVEEKEKIERLINNMNIPPLVQKLDYQTGNVTIQKIFNKIPSEEELKKTIQDIQQNPVLKKSLENYSGEYEIVYRASKKREMLKPEAKSIYQLFSVLNLPKVSEDFKKLKAEEKVKLSSFEVTKIGNQNKKQKKNKNQPKKLLTNQNDLRIGQLAGKTTKLQRNSISEDYLYELKEQIKSQQILPLNQYLKNNDVLVHICIYDAVNREKQTQYIFLGDMKLIQVKNKIDCLVERLAQQNQNQCDKPQKGQKKSSKNNKNYGYSSFFLVQNNIYYQGAPTSQHEVDNLIKTVKISYEKDLFKFSMNNIEIKNLRVVFGRPYLYRHMGGCDHMIVFKDIRLFDQQSIDPEIKKKYPLMVFESKMKRKKCQGCDNKFAGYACIGDKLKEGQTIYLCAECHQNIHNDLTNPKNPYLKVIPYLHD